MLTTDDDAQLKALQNAGAKARAKHKKVRVFMTVPYARFPKNTTLRIP
jgi:hypothetical protein